MILKLKDLLKATTRSVLVVLVVLVALRTLRTLTSHQAHQAHQVLIKELPAAFFAAFL